MAYKKGYNSDGTWSYRYCQSAIDALEIDVSQIDGVEVVFSAKAYDPDIGMFTSATRKIVCRGEDSMDRVKEWAQEMYAKGLTKIQCECLHIFGEKYEGSRLNRGFLMLYEPNSETKFRTVNNV